MPDERQGPTFNLKAVVQQTGVKPDTLRAWERRYGLPQPRRSAGRHRLYSLRDVQAIQWLVDRQAEGLSISRAVDLWRQMEAEGRDPLQTAPPTAAPPAAPPLTAAGALDHLRCDWVTACLAFDEPRADQALTQAFALYPPEVVCLEVLQWGVAEIGEGWYRGQATVQQEHFATELALRRLEALIAAAPPPSRPGRFLVAAPPGEEHTFSLLLLAFLLRRRGWHVVYLGANVPAERLESTVALTRPQVVILAAQRLDTAATLLGMARRLAEEGVPLAFGGRIFNLLPALRVRVPGHFMGETLEGAPQAAERLLARPEATPAVEPLPEEHARAREHMDERRPLIEAELVRQADALGIQPRHLSIANAELGHTIAAGLSLGDLGFVGADLAWIEGLLEHHGIPAGALRGYLAAYRAAAQAHLDDRGRPILDWLDRLLHEEAT